MIYVICAATAFAIWACCRVGADEDERCGWKRVTTSAGMLRKSKCVMDAILWNGYWQAVPR